METEEIANLLSLRRSPNLALQRTLAPGRAYSPGMVHRSVAGSAELYR